MAWSLAGIWTPTMSICTPSSEVTRVMVVFPISQIRKLKLKKIEKLTQILKIANDASKS